MSLWQRILNRVSLQKPSADRAPNFRRSQSGQRVDEDRALRYSAVWACVNVIAKSIAILPWNVFEKTEQGNKEAFEHPVNWLLHNQPNPEMTPFHFKLTLVAHALTWGNGYAEIERDGMGRPVWLWPITPDRVTPDRDENGRIIYRVWNGSSAAETRLAPENMLHLRGLGFDGLIGYSVIKMASESIGLGLAMEEFGSSFFGNGANMSGVLKHPKTLGPEATKNLEDSMKRRASGRNALSTLVLEEGMTYERIGIPPEDAQFLESRSHQVLDICRWYGVPPHKVAELDRATWGNIESEGIRFNTDTLQPWITPFEEEVNLKLFGRQQRGKFYSKFNLNALLRGDMTARFTAYGMALDKGWMCADEVRALEEQNPLPGGQGKIYLVQSAMVTRETLMNAPTVAPAPPKDPQEPPQDPPNIRKLPQRAGNSHV